MNEVSTKREGIGAGNGHGANGAPHHSMSEASKPCLSQEDQAAEVPEVFQMPPVPTTRVRARVRHVGQAPFVFVDELAD